MFSENEIVQYCRHCDVLCEDMKKCPLKIKWSAADKRKIFAAVSDKWNFLKSRQCVYAGSADIYSAEQLIAGLDRLSCHLSFRR